MTEPKLVERVHVSGGERRSAVYSPCDAYRYALTVEWSAAGRRLGIVMLNPSTASEMRNDPTIERCARRARALGYGAMRIVNLFAYRATLPRDLKAARDPVGPANDGALRDIAVWLEDRGETLAAWGVHGAHLGRGAAVERSLRAAGVPLLHLGTTRDGYPRHPLYVAYARRPVVWDQAAGTTAMSDAVIPGAP